MARVLTNESDPPLLEAFKSRVDEAKRIDIVTAWATDCDALAALEAKENCTVRAVVGLSERITNPCALEKLVEIGNVRVVDQSSGIFHPKVYIFHLSDRRFAWIGSANFTNPGFHNNYELVFETSVSNKLTEWFDDLWKQQRCKRLTKKVLDEYRHRFEQKPGREPGVEPNASEELGALRNARVTKLHFKPNGKRPPPKGKSGAGKLLVTYVNGPTKTLGYASSAEAVRKVLEVLSGGQAGFLEECARAFGKSRVRDSYSGPQRSWLSQNKHEVQSHMAGKYQIHATEVIAGWWLSQDTNPDRKWWFVVKAAELAGVDYHSDRLWRRDYFKNFDQPPPFQVGF